MIPARATVAALIAVGALACGDPPGSGVDAGSGGGDASDGGGTGLHLRFRATPAPPAELGGAFACDLDRVVLRLANLRFAGDAAQADDPRIQRPSAEMEWETERTFEYWFEQAPPGRYASLLATVTRYRIEGRATVDEVREYEIEEDPIGMAIELPLDLVLEPGATLTIDIDVAVAAAVLGVPWDKVALDEGELEVDESSPEIIDVRQRLLEGIAISTTGPG
jgi:hypothetical protein